MGLDLAEMIMDVEDGFGFTIPEDATLDCIGPTVGGLTASVQAQLKDHSNRKCYSGFCFRRLREAIHHVRECDDPRVRPSTPLSEIVPHHDEASFYLKVRNQLGEYKKALPEYDLSWQLPEHPISVASMILGCIAVVMLIMGLIPWWICILGIVIFSLLAENIEFHRSNRPGSIFRKARFPLHTRTVGDVATVMSTNLSPDDMGGAVPLPTEVSKRIKAIVSKYANLPPEKIKDTDHFINDLGLD